MVHIFKEVLQDSNPLALVVIYPEQLEEESVPAGIKGQLQKLAGLSEWYSIISPINGTDT